MIKGDANDNILVGVKLGSQRPGQGERDIFVGKQGADTFVLGNADGIFYNDGNANSAGKQDFARIRDFSLEQGDVIQWQGQASDYTLGAVSRNNPNCVWVVANSSGEKELIGIVKGIDAIALESPAFQFV